MSISKITNLELNIGKSFTTDKGTFYPFRVTLADGTEGIANSTSPTPKWQIGQDVGYTAEQGKYGLKIKLMKADQGFYGAPKRTEQICLTQPFDDAPQQNASKANKFNTGDIEKGMCLKLANDILIHNHAGQQIDVTLLRDELYAIAEQVLAASVLLRTLPNT